VKKTDVYTDASYCFESKLLQGSIGIHKCNHQMLSCLYFDTNACVLDE